MFCLVWVIQVKSTGEFLTPRLNYATRIHNAGFFTNKQSATDTAMNELDTDFEIFSFYMKETDLPSYCLGGERSPPQ